MAPNADEEVEGVDNGRLEVGHDVAVDGGDVVVVVGLVEEDQQVGGQEADQGQAEQEGVGDAHNGAAAL